jgi:hypothetical protein
LPGLVLEFAIGRELRLEDCIMVGAGRADRTMAQRLHMTYADAREFFG